MDEAVDPTAPTTQAVILVGGRGTRLGKLTDDTPKPLLRVGPRPFLDYVVQALARHGFKDILLLSGYRADAIEDYCRSHGRPGATLRCLAEPAPLGTGGSLVSARAHLSESFLALNGDTLFDINFNDLLVPQDACLVRMALRHVEDTARYGRIVLNGARVLSMQEKGRSGPGSINGGIYAMQRRALDVLPPGPSSIETDLLPKLIAQGAVEGRTYEGFFLDVGIPEDFAFAQTAVPESLKRPAVFLDRDGVLNEDTGYVARRADFKWIAGARESVKRLNDAGYYVFVITNQAGIARGYHTHQDVADLHAWMQQDLRSIGAHVDGFYYCPHHPDFTGPCACRKPEPGLVLQALSEWPVLAEQSFLIGDKDSDVKAAQKAGLKGYRFAGSGLLAFTEQVLSRAATHRASARSL